MTKLADYNGPSYPVQINDEEFIVDQAITAAGTTTGTIEIEAGRNMGATAVALVATSAVSVADAGKLGLVIKAAREKGGTYTTVVPETDIVAPSGSAATFATGELIGTVSVPFDAESIWKTDLVVTGAANTGTVSVVPYYLPR